MKKLISIGLLFLIFLTACNNSQETILPNINIEDKTIKTEVSLRIITTNKLLYNMVKDIVKDDHIVDYMMAEEESQWKFKFSQDSLKNIASKDIFIYFGAGFEPWANEFEKNVEKGNVSVINCSRGIRTLELEDPIIYEEEVIKSNPYYWLDSNNYKIVLSNIKNGIQEKDPARRQVYEKNFEEAIKKLDEVNKELSSLIKEYKDYTFITNTEELDYFFNKFSIKPTRLLSEDKILEMEEQIYQVSDDSKYIFVYCDDNKLAYVENIVNNSKVLKVKLASYCPEKNCLDLWQGNYKAFKVLKNKAS